MSDHNQVRVQLDGDQALITAAGRSFHVSRRDRMEAISNCPMQLMLGALGACIMLTIEAVAGNKGIALQRPDVRIDYVTNGNGRTRFNVTLALGGHLTERERKILYQSARICEVGKLLKSDVSIDYQLENQTDHGACDGR